MVGYAALQTNDVEAGRRAFEQATAFEPHRKAAMLAIRQLPKTQQRPPEKRSSL